MWWTCQMVSSILSMPLQLPLLGLADLRTHFMKAGSSGRKTQGGKEKSWFYDMPIYVWYDMYILYTHMICICVYIYICIYIHNLLLCSMTSWYHDYGFLKRDNSTSFVRIWNRDFVLMFLPRFSGFPTCYRASHDPGTVVNWPFLYILWLVG